MQGVYDADVRPQEKESPTFSGFGDDAVWKLWNVRVVMLWKQKALYLVWPSLAFH